MAKPYRKVKAERAAWDVVVRDSRDSYVTRFDRDLLSETTAKETAVRLNVLFATTGQSLTAFSEKQESEI